MYDSESLDLLTGVIGTLCQHQAIMLSCIHKDISTSNNISHIHRLYLKFAILKIL